MVVADQMTKMLPHLMAASRAAEMTPYGVFLAKLQRFVAESMISHSALRNVGAAGAVQRARDFLALLSLRGLHRVKSAGYLSWLDSNTERLRLSLPPPAQRWGAARKAMNIFMRSVTYTTPLAEAYRLQHLLPYLEVPLDRDVAIGLKMRQGNTVAVWKSIVSLTPDIHRRYQRAAMCDAQERRVHRADLDVFYWRQKK
jgi:hypothetical protein